jgi:hypothetical protein
MINEKYRVDIHIMERIADGAYGETKWVDSHRKPKHCTVQLRRMKNNGMMLSTLAHELTHVKQLFLNELVDDIHSETDYIWKKKYRFDITKDYWLLPWEIEANGYEVALVELFRAKFALTQNDIQKDLQLVLKKIEFFDTKAVEPHS